MISIFPNRPPQALPRSSEEWLARLAADDVSDAERVAFDEWLDASEENRVRWSDLNVMWIDIEPLRSDPAMVEMRRQAVGRSGWIAQARKTWPVALALSIAAGLLAVVSWDRGRLNETEIVRSETPSDAYFSTPVGKMSSILLADGSIVQLDADSAFTVRLDQARRGVTLLRGRALFKVMKDPRRPFVVSVDGRTVTALGTVFSVDLQRRATRVVLAEGAVRVADPLSGSKDNRARNVVDMRPGQMLIAGENDAWQIKAVPPAQSLGWTSGQLLFDDEMLTDVVAEVNRYTKTHIIIGDDRVGVERLSAVLQAGDVETLLAGVVQLNLASPERQGNVIILRGSAVRENIK